MDSVHTYTYVDTYVQLLSTVRPVYLYSGHYVRRVATTLQLRVSLSPNSTNVTLKPCSVPLYIHNAAMHLTIMSNYNWRTGIDDCIGQ